VPEKRGKILVVRGGAIGDFILTLPAITALRNTFTGAHLEVLGYPVVAELAQAGGLIDGFRSIEAGPLSRFFARDAKPDPAWVEYFESFNLIISYLYDPDAIFRTNVGCASKAQFIQGPHRPDEQCDTHATAVFLKPLEQLAIFDTDPAPRISVPKKSASAEATLGPGKWIAIHPGSGSERKNWKLDRWFTVLQWVQTKTDWNVLLVGGEAEGNRLAELSVVLAEQRVRFAERLPLADLAALLAQCHLFLGHDSGITHLAAATGCQVVALWGPSKRAIWQPLHQKPENLRILEAPAGDLEQLTAETVIEAIKDVASQ
jgi:heptosyltransferase-3